MRSHAIPTVSHAPAATAWVASVAFLAAGFVAVLVTTAAGQQGDYEVLAVDEQLTQERRVKQMQSALRAFATSKDPASYRNVALTYVANYVPKRITDPNAVDEIWDLTSALVDAVKASQRSRSPEARTIAAQVYRGMSAIANGNYHPPARIAATLVLAKLDLGQPAQNQPPRIIPQVIGDLLTLYSDESNDEGVRAAALQGLHRQVGFGFGQLTDAARQQVAAEMMKLLDSPPPPTRSPEAHAYLQRFAVDLLRVLKQPDDTELATKLVSISTARNQPDLIAFHSASRIAGMQDGLSGNVETPAVVLDQWSGRLLRAFRKEVGRLKSFDPPASARDQPRPPREVLQGPATETQRRRGGGGYGEDYDPGSDMEAYGQMGVMEDMGDYEGYGDSGMEAYGFMPGRTRATDAKPQPPEVLGSRRQLNLLLQQVHLAVTGSRKAGNPRQPGGLLAAAEEGDRQVIRRWVSRMEEVVNSVNDDFLEDRTKFIEAIEEILPILEELAGDEADERLSEPEADLGDEAEDAEDDLDRIEVTPLTASP